MWHQCNTGPCAYPFTELARAQKEGLGLRGRLRVHIVFIEAPGALHHGEDLKWLSALGHAWCCRLTASAVRCLSG